MKDTRAVIDTRPKRSAPEQSRSSRFSQKKQDKLELYRELVIAETLLLSSTATYHLHIPKQTPITDTAAHSIRLIHGNR